MIKKLFAILIALTLLVGASAIAWADDAATAGQQVQSSTDNLNTDGNGAQDQDQNWQDYDQGQNWQDYDQGQNGQDSGQNWNNEGDENNEGGCEPCDECFGKEKKHKKKVVVIKKVVVKKVVQKARRAQGLPVTGGLPIDPLVALGAGTSALGLSFIRRPKRHD
ncbi:MAG: hypothetical protein AB1743_03470 [Actinomycetota bacterium]